MEFALIWIACGVFAGMVASSKGRSGFGWFLLGVLFGPFALLGAIGVSGSRQETVQPGKNAACRACRKPIDLAATICPYCRTDSPITEADRALAVSIERGRRHATLLAIVMGSLLFAWCFTRTPDRPTSSTAPTASDAYSHPCGDGTWNEPGKPCSPDSPWERTEE